MKILRLLFLIGLLAGPALAVNCSNTSIGGGFTCIQSNVHFTSSTSTSAALTNHATGNLIHVGVAANDTHATVSFSVSNTAGYSFSVACAALRDVSSVHWTENFYVVVPSTYSGTDTFTASDSGATGVFITVTEYHGTSGTPLDGSCASATNVNTTTSITTAPYSATTGDLAIGYCLGGANTTSGSGWTTRATDTSGPYEVQEDQVVSGGTATATCVNGSSNSVWVIMGMAFKSSSASIAIKRRREALF